MAKSTTAIVFDVRQHTKVCPLFMEMRGSLRQLELIRARRRANSSYQTQQQIHQKLNATISN